MKRFLSIAVVLALFAPTSTRAAFVPDGTFEATVIPPNTFQYNPPSAFWNFTGNSGLINGNSPFGNTIFDGSQVAFLQSNANQGAGIQGNISQNFSFTGGTYTVQFFAEKRGGSLNAQPSFIVQIDGATIGTFSPTTTSTYTSFTTANFNVTAGFHTLAFIATGPTDSTSFIDDVSLNAVPEPASLAMLGFGLLASGTFFAKKTRRNRN